MELRRYLELLNRRKWVVIVTAIVTLAVVAFGTSRMTPVYSASALVRVTQGNASTVSGADLNYTERLIQTYVQLLKSRPLLEKVVQRLDLGMSPGQLAGMVKAEAVTGTELVRISTESTDAEQAAAVANTLAQVLVEQGQTLYSGQGKSAKDIILEQLTVVESQLSSDRRLLASLSSAAAVAPQPPATPGPSVQELAVRISAEEQTYSTLLNQYEKARLDEAMRANSISIAEDAVVAKNPSKPKKMMNLVLGALVGLGGGIGLGLLMENLDPTVHSADDVESAVAQPLLSRIPSFTKHRRRGSILLRSDGTKEPPEAEAFRVLAGRLRTVLANAGAKSLLVASAEPGAGKTTILTNLALALAQGGLRVTVVDGDLRNPSVHRVFGLPRGPGLTDVIADSIRLRASVRATGTPRVEVLTVGSARRPPIQLLTDKALAGLAKALTDGADVVLWDSSPLLAAADAELMLRVVDGVLLVATRDHSAARHLAQVADQVESSGGKLLGVIYNRAARDHTTNYYGRYRWRPAPAAPGANGSSYEPTRAPQGRGPAQESGGAAYPAARPSAAVRGGTGG